MLHSLGKRTHDDFVAAGSAQPAPAWAAIPHGGRPWPPSAHDMTSALGGTPFSPLVPPRNAVWDALQALDPLSLRSLLMTVSDSHERVARDIWDQYQKGRQAPTPPQSSSSELPLCSEWKEQNLEPSENAVKRVRFSLAISPAVSEHSLAPSLCNDVHTDPNLPEPAHFSRILRYGQPDSGPDTPRSDHGRVDACTASSSMPFDDECRAIWWMLKRAHKTKTEAAQKKVAPDVCSEVLRIVKSVAKEATPDDAPFVVRRNALQTLRNIGEGIYRATGTLGAEVRKCFQSDTSLEDGMLDILWKMSQEERDRMACLNDCLSTWQEKLEGLREIAQLYGVFGNLGTVLQALKGELRNPADPPIIKREDDDDDEAVVLADIPTRIHHEPQPNASTIKARGLATPQTPRTAPLDKTPTIPVCSTPHSLPMQPLTPASQPTRSPSLVQEPGPLVSIESVNANEALKPPQASATLSTYERPLHNDTPFNKKKAAGPSQTLPRRSTRKSTARK
ncbi:hypothetical protein BS50DRAFT_571853 [Corynespora cassiicola Philippines]|uniref:Uncharacterized protein n=1 Tax=Corynespora cassiicola Philippines TaxID=1448308 RepID=A0A2T2NT56_CORCC|nr:hypothetical protein BS50DRAFT_571853 [Corynespora cassiicola Philippines]